MGAPPALSTTSPRGLRGWLRRSSYVVAGLAAGLSLRPGIAALCLLAAAVAVAGVIVLRRFYWFLPAEGLVGDRVALFRWLAVGCQAVTIIVTWDLWQVRDAPPMLPVPGVGVGQVSVGVLLLASLALTLARPRVGAWSHVVVLAYACLADQTRLQPETVSLAVLVLATALPRVGPTLARSHLSSLWIWSGLHKLLSTGFATGSALFIFNGLPVRPAALASRFGWIVAGTEIAVGVLTAVPRLRRFGVVAAFALHGLVLYVLSPWGNDWNVSVWPWNLALPLAALAFVWPADPRSTGEEAMPPVPGSGRPVWVYAIPLVAMVFPAGFYLGVVDAYVSHNLYSDTNAAAFCLPAGCRSASFNATWDAFEVPLPPEPRLYVQYFDELCQPGEQLVVAPRRVRLLFGVDSRRATHACPATDPQVRVPG